ALLPHHLRHDTLARFMQQFVESLGLVYDPTYLSTYVKPLIRILSLMLMGMVTLKLIDSALKRLINIVPGSDSRAGRHVERRAETLRQIVRSVGRVVLGVVVIIYLANDLGYDLAPLLAGA